ncbi:hypothetical protein CSAL01_03057 [Colletotrichum salicis]|uniref:Uncharacterized protein n=1 Tax=Colletotrichum salicis TaxID=1209931 RepID=A0A135SS45_9PEZI|nr:hypothetical protein CSAL01_03057 [Colletotrichum salicis]
MIRIRAVLVERPESPFALAIVSVAPPVSRPIPSAGSIKGHSKIWPGLVPAERAFALRMTVEWNHNHISMPMLRPVTPKPMSEFDGDQGILSDVSPARKKPDADAGGRTATPPRSMANMGKTCHKGPCQWNRDCGKPVAAIAVIPGPNANLSIGFCSDSSPLARTRPSAIAQRAHAVRHRLSTRSGTWPEAAMPSIKDGDPNLSEDLR